MGRPSQRREWPTEHKFANIKRNLRQACDAITLTVTQAVAECEKVADEISDGIKRAMPCDCRAMGSRVRCGDCGQ